MVADVDALLAEVLAAPADVAALVAEVLAAVADVPAAVADVLAADADVAEAEADAAAAASLVMSCRRMKATCQVLLVAENCSARPRTYTAVGQAARIMALVVSCE